MGTRKIGITLIHDTDSNNWYQLVSLCTFWSNDSAMKYDVSRLPIDEKQSRLLIEQLSIKEYFRTEKLIWYGCFSVRKVRDIEMGNLKNLANRTKSKVSGVIA